MDFSVVVIARNEEATLPRLLSSLAEFIAEGGEVVVVDTGSTDGTRAVAESAGVRVVDAGTRFVRPVTSSTAGKVNRHFIIDGEPALLTAGDRIFDFAEARNFAADQASCDMISMPDCDEVFTALNLPVIRDAILSGVDQFHYDFVYAHDDAGQPTVKFKHSKFYDRRKLRWKGIVHEVLHSLAAVQQSYVPPEVILLEHFQNAQTDRSSYLRGLALDCFENPDNDRNSHYFGRELYYTKRYRSALQELDRHIYMRGWAAERSQSAVLKGLCWEALEHPEVAERCFFDALRIDASRREPWLRLAWAAKHRGDAQRVASYGQAALGVLSAHYYADVQADFREVPHKLLYWAYWQLGDKDQSKHHFDKALSFAPEDAELLRDRVCYYP